MRSLRLNIGYLYCWVLAIGLLIIDAGLLGGLIAGDETRLIKSAVLGVVALTCFYAFVFVKKTDYGATVTNLFSYVFLCFASLTYSIDIETTLFTLIPLCVIFLSVVVLIFRFPEFSLMIVGCLSFLTGISAILSIVLFVFFPDYVISTNVAGEGRVAGVFGSPNGLGGVAGLGLLFSCACALFDKFCVLSRKTHILLCFPLIVCVYLSGSRTAALCTVISVVILFYISLIKYRNFFRLSGLSIFILFFVYGIMFSFDFVTIFSRDNGDDLYTLTGRSAVWDFSIDAWFEHPLLGYGFGASRALLLAAPIHVWTEVASAHNFFLESLLNVGLIGTLSLLIIFLSTIYKAVLLIKSSNHVSFSIGATCLSAMIFLLLHGITEKSFAGTVSFPTGIVFICYSLTLIFQRLEIIYSFNAEGYRRGFVK